MKGSQEGDERLKERLGDNIVVRRQKARSMAEERKEGGKGKGGWGVGR